MSEEKKRTRVKRTPSPGGVRAHSTESKVLEDVPRPKWKPRMRRDRNRGQHVPLWIKESLPSVNPKDYNLKYDHPAIYEGDAKFSPEMKLEAAMAYMLCGTIKAASQICGVPTTTISSWKRSDWWGPVTDQIRKDREAELDAKVDQILHKSFDQLADRLKNGDVIYDRKLHEEVRVSMSARDITNVASSTHRIRSLLRGDATNISETKTRDEQIKDLREEFKRFAEARTIDGDVEK